MDDRLAKLLLENNIMIRIKRTEGDVALLQKLATQSSIVLETLPVPGETEPPASASNTLFWQNVFLFDDFIGGFEVFNNVGSVNPQSGIGNLNWNGSNYCSFQIVDAPLFSVSHPGILSIYTEDAVTAPVVAILLGGTSLGTAGSPLLVDSFLFMQGVISISAGMDTGDFVVFGAMEDDFADSATELAAEGVFFFRRESDANWQVRTQDGVGATTTNTGVPFVDGAWYMLEIKRIASGIEFYINSVIVATHTTNIASILGLAPTFGSKQNSALSPFTYRIDYFAMQLNPIVQRWD